MGGYLEEAFAVKAWDADRVYVVNDARGVIGVHCNFEDGLLKRQQRQQTAKEITGNL